MDTFQAAAQALNLSLEELVMKVVHGRLCKTKEDDRQLAQQILRRYNEYRMLPAYLQDYCEAILKRRPEELPLWSLAQAEGVANGNP